MRPPSRIVALLTFISTVLYRGSHATNMNELSGLSYGTYCVQNVKSGRYLSQDIVFSNVQTGTSCQNAESYWRFVSLGGGKYAIQNMWSKNWLKEVIKDNQSSPGDNVLIRTDHLASESQWSLSAVVSPEFVVQNLRSSFFLSEDINSSNAQGNNVQVDEDGKALQNHWILNPAPSPGPSPVAPAKAIEFRIAENSPTMQSSPFLHRCVGSGHAWLGLRKDWQEQLAMVKKDLDMEFVRFHGLLDDDMEVYRGPGQYNFSNVDIVYDFILSIGMRPVVELSFMPAALARGSDTGFYPKNRSCHINPPADYNEWGRLIAALGKHFVERYGEEEVVHWFFEVWNEPNCGFFKTSDPRSQMCCGTCGDMSEYMKLYDYSSSALKSVSSRLRVGGPATAQLGRIDDFIKAVKDDHLLGGEVVTSHVYPTDPMTTFLGVFQSIAKAAQKGQHFSQTFILSEFNSGLYGDDVANHDRAFAAAFLVSFAADVYQRVAHIPRVHDFLASYWTFSDVFEEQGFPIRDFQNGYGMMTFKGIPKPAYRVMQLLNFGTDVISITSNITDAGTREQVKAVALHSEGRGAGRKVRIFISNLDIPTVTLGEADVTLKFDQVPSTVVVYRIDPSHANPREVWEEMGKPDLQGANLSKVMRASEAIPEILQPNAVSLVVPPRSCAVVEASWLSASADVQYV